MYSSIRCLDIYKEREDSNLRKITFTISIQNYKKTLTEKDFEKIKEKIASVLKKKIKVTLED
jgi:phenylalanyl-tRNA synthetase beta subunit